MKEEYNATSTAVPENVSEWMTVNTRWAEDKDKAIFDQLMDSAPTYDAYERDIAVAHFYFEAPTVFQYSRQVRHSRV